VKSTTYSSTTPRLRRAVHGLQGKGPLCNTPIWMKFWTEILWLKRINVALILTALKQFKVAFFASRVWKFILFFAFLILTAFLLLKFKRAAFCHEKKRHRCLRCGVFWDREVYVCQRVPLKIIWPSRWVATQENGNVECTCVGTRLAYIHDQQTLSCPKRIRTRSGAIFSFSLSLYLFGKYRSEWPNSGGASYAYCWKVAGLLNPNLYIHTHFARCQHEKNLQMATLFHFISLGSHAAIVDRQHVYLLLFYWKNNNKYTCWRSTIALV